MALHSYSRSFVHRTSRMDRCWVGVGGKVEWWSAQLGKTFLFHFARHHNNTPTSNGTLMLFCLLFSARLYLRSSCWFCCCCFHLNRVMLGNMSYFNWTNTSFSMHLELFIENIRYWSNKTVESNSKQSLILFLVVGLKVLKVCKNMLCKMPLTVCSIAILPGSNCVLDHP